MQADPVELVVAKPYPPLGILYLSAWLKKEGIKLDVYDPTFSDMDSMKNDLVRKSPDILGFYTTLMTRQNILNLTRFIRDHKDLHSTKIIIGGPDARYYTDLYLKNGADIIIPGEGEQSLSETLRSLEMTGSDDLGIIKGIIFSDNNGNIINTGERALINPDEIPFPDRESIDMTSYLEIWKTKHAYTSLTVNTMRGCPYSCTWCSKSVFGNTYRRRNPELVADELQILRETYNPDQIWFTDDVFTINKQWIQKFTAELEKRNLLLPYECISRADCMDEEMIDLLKRTGCRQIWIGAESGSQKVIDLMNRRINVEETIKVISGIKKAGISTGIFIMTGYKGENFDDILKTSDFLKKTKPDNITIGMAYPIKGTKFFSEVVEQFIEPYNEELQNERQIRFRSRDYDNFYKNAIRYLYNIYTASKSKFGWHKLIFRSKALISKIVLKFLSLSK